MGFTAAELEAYRDAVVPDLVAPGVRLLFVGINPSLWTAATGAPFSRPGNRFYPALAAAGITSRELRPAAGLTQEDRAELVGRGIGITNLVRRATVRADELSAAELREGAERLHGTVSRWSPEVVAVAGVTAYRVAFGLPKARAGRQPENLEGAALWVVPNPSGLNAHDTVTSLAAAYAAPARAAGLLPPTD
ncbi:MAG: putative glycosylase [Naasia sp.]|uniref:mismatch-specific DNA-glycosylase n=1 Tax=Naasia sp. TaxID=2546198 RepID=UPI002639739A|nr:mismatch-specific DNA-glycosylase [Naasia sp.]MCU1569497.1 putative glycosylase [Naasia sp.]